MIRDRKLLEKPDNVICQKNRYMPEDEDSLKTHELCEEIVRQLLNDE